jgi:hypothetical protein
MAERRINPGSLVGLAYVLQSGYPKMTANTAVNNAAQIIRGLHRMGLEVGPQAAFGPQATQPATALDALDVAADMIELETGRKPWLP